VSGGIVDVLQFAIDGVTATQNTVADNLSNAETPGYTDTETSFESSLDQALNSPGTATATLSNAPSTDPPATNGNNVSLSNELLEAEKATLQYQTVTESLNAQFRLVAGASGGSYT
jgi:flagellar basal-body rod protein FlgB